MTFEEWSNKKKKKSQDSLEDGIKEKNNESPVTFADWSNAKHGATTTDDDEDIAPVKNTVETTQEIYDKWGKYYHESDFKEYSVKGANIGNPTYDEAAGYWMIVPFTGKMLGGKEVDNVVTFSRENYDEIVENGGYEGNPMATKRWDTRYIYMTDFEVSIYNYLLAKNGKESAQEFLDDIGETLNVRWGKQVAENTMNEENAVLRAAGYTINAINGGISSSVVGTKQLFSEEALPITPAEVTDQILLENLDGWKKNLYQAGNTVGNMIPSVAVSFLSPAAGRILQSSSAGGNAYRQALNEGKTKEEAAAYGVMSGILEFATSKLLSGVAGTTGDLPKKALSKIATFENGLLRFGAKYGINLASEVTEEELQLWLEPIARKLAFGEEYDAPTIEEMAETAIVTALSTGILNSTTDIATGNLTKVDGLSVHEAKVIEAEVKNRVAEQEADGKKLTSKEKNKIREDVIDQMNKGQLDIDTIESVLGGKTYEEYKSLTERETALTEEISRLENTRESEITVKQRERLAEAREELSNLTNKTELKTRLSEEVFGIAKNTRLAETYAERARKGQAFEADLTQYKGKQREAVERAVKSGVLNNTYRAHELVDVLSKIEADKGIAFDYTNNEKLKESGFAVEGKTVNGFVKDGGVTLNVQSSKAWQSTVGHEIAHVLEGTEAYSALREALYAHAERKGELASRKTALTELYKDMDADIDAELTADLVGDYLFTDKDFINKLTGNRTLFQKVWDEVKYLCKVATGKELTEIEKVERAFAKAWKTFSAESKATDGKIQFSINATEDGTKYVKLDGNIFLKEDGSEMSPSEAYNALVGTQITLEDGDVINFIKKLPDVKLYYELFRKYPGHDGSIDIKSLNQAINKNIVDVFAVSSAKERNEKQIHEHKGIADFDLREVYIADDSNAYRLELYVANLTDGSKAAYVKRYVERADPETAEKIKKAETAWQTHLNQPSKIGQSVKSDTLPTDDIISQNSENVNTKFSLSSDSDGNSFTDPQMDIDKNDDLGYNENELYTVSDSFVLEVDKNDRNAFSRSLANKTSDLEKDEIRTVEIYGADKVYYFEATGYMQGQMLYSANVDDIADYTRRKDYIYAKDGNRRLFNRWSSVLSSDRGRESSDIHSTENRRTEADVYGVYGESRKSNSTGTQERNGQNFKDDPKEVEGIVAELRKEYGLTENHSTNEIAPIKEASSTGDVFFDGENPKHSLSNEGEEIAPIGNYSTPLNETALEDIAPVAENATTNDSVAQVLTEEPKTEKRKQGIFPKVITNFIDKGAAVENLSLKTKNRALQDKYKAIGRSETKAQYFMENGTENVKSLDAIRAEVEKTGKVQDFYNYIYHKHNVDRMNLESKERPNLERLEGEMKKLKLLHLQENQLRAIASEKITKETAPKRAKLIKTVRKYLASKDVKNKPVFDYSVTSEMSQSIVNEYETKNSNFKEYAQDVYDYMNHLRKMMVNNGIISPETAKLWAELYPHYVPIRRADQEGLAINVPLDTNKTGINAPIKRATGGNSDILPLFNTMAQRTSQTFKAIDKNRFGIELKDTLGGVTENTKTSLDEVIDSIDAQDNLLQEGKNGKNPTFTVFEGGDRVTFEITEELYDALKPTSEGLMYTNKVLNTASNLHRGVLTEYSVPFMITNAIKDAQDVLMNSQHPARTYANFPAAINELRKKGKWYTEYMENGGGDNTYFDKQTNTFNKEKSRLRKIIGFPFDKISDANNFIEKIPRLAEYIASRKKGASVDAAMLDAARVTTDFSAGGDVTKFFNRNGATFLNASVQGFAQQVRNVREAKMNGLKGWLGLATKCAIAGLPTMLLNHLFWDDDEEYEELSDYVKKNYYIVGKYGDGKFVRIPKGRTLAVIQNGFEQVSNALTGDDEADFGKFFELFLSNLAPNNPLDNNIIAPIKQVVENKTWYGEDLVPTRLQDLPATEQYDESTDAISKWLGEKTNVSPYKINYLLNQYSGGIGDILMPMITPEAERGDDSFLGNVIAPLRDKFTTDSTMNNQNVSDFYDTVDVLTTNAKSSYATDEDILKSKYINSVNSELSDLYKAKREIQNSNLSDSVKYEQVRNLQKQINDLAKNALDSFENVDVQDGYATVGDKHYRLDDGTWTKISAKQLERQQQVTSELGISPAEYWSKTDISYFPNSDGEYEYAYDHPEKYALSKSVGGYSAYKAYTNELNDIKADKDENGKSITGSRKEKVLEYINGLDADYETKIILYKSEYPSDDTYNMDIVNYLNEREDLTYEDRVTILTELGFTVTDDGSIYW